MTKFMFMWLVGSKCSTLDYNICSKHVYGVNLLCQNLWEVMGGSTSNQAAFWKVEIVGCITQKVGGGSAMFAFKITIENKMLEHIRKAKTLKNSRNAFPMLFSSFHITACLFKILSIINTQKSCPEAIFPEAPSCSFFSTVLEHVFGLGIILNKQRLSH